MPTQKQKKKCEVCGGMIFGSHKIKYCPSCRREVIKNNTKRWMIKNREKHRLYMKEYRSLPLRPEPRKEPVSDFIEV